MSFGVGDYPDYTRVSSQQPAEPAWLLFGSNTGNQSSQVINCSDYGYLYIYAHELTSQCQVIVWWSDTSSFTALRGGRQFAVDPAVLNAAEKTYPNLGPFVQVTVEPLGGAATTFTGTVYVRMTNQPAVAIGMADGQVMGSYGGIVPAGGQLAGAFSISGGGLTFLHSEGGTEGIDVALTYLSDSFTTPRFCSYAVAANEVDERTIVTPFAPVYYSLTNQSPTVACDNALIVAIPNF